MDGQAANGNSWGLCPQTPRIYRFGAKIGLDWGSELSLLPTNRDPGSALRSHPCVALTSAPASWKFTSTLAEVARAWWRILFHFPCRVLTELSSGKGTGTRWPRAEWGGGSCSG